MVQVPEMSSEAVVPETVQTVGVVDVKLTVRPELAVADKPSAVVATSVAVMAGNVMLWASFTVKLSEISGAAE